MKEIYQDVKGPFGNCLSACIASILEIDLEFIPNFNLDENNIPDPNNWRERFVDYLNSIEMTFIEIQVYHCEERLLPDCHNILSGPVIGRSKDEVWHSVVGWKTRIIH
nr:hypothetical protein [Nitrosopumilaceae archaeon]NIU86596.1 hypothetical protein [Nitrosopumilaceae archaeon]NIV65283.1 hypothetical protein [Nitrosopumilaceae archaeon]NIX60784.1 hypothetical protein [Nitrosopumilaceae archaeon]